jgi:flagellar biogenesis protein FliO
MDTTESDIESGLLPDVPELGQIPEKNCAPLFGGLYLLLIFAVIGILVYLFVRFIQVF